MTGSVTAAAPTEIITDGEQVIVQVCLKSTSGRFGDAHPAATFLIWEDSIMTQWWLARWQRGAKGAREPQLDGMIQSFNAMVTRAESAIGGHPIDDLSGKL